MSAPAPGTSARERTILVYAMGRTRRWRSGRRGRLADELRPPRKVGGRLEPASADTFGSRLAGTPHLFFRALALRDLLLQFLVLALQVGQKRQARLPAARRPRVRQARRASLFSALRSAACASFSPNPLPKYASR